ncbi:MAG TPA: hypothetical protein VGH19_02660 [Verrucomicrobiae bacterium]
MNTPSDKTDSTALAAELRFFRLALLLCFGTTVLLIGLHIHSDICVVVGFLFLLPTLYLKAVHLFRLLYDAPLIAAIRESALSPKDKSQTHQPPNSPPLKSEISSKPQE